jgi:hypothetical protein
MPPVLFWRPQVALFVNEQTLLPVLMPFAPAVSTLEWFRVAAADVLSAHGVRRSFVDREPAETPCSPLYGTQVSPDRALAAIAR